MRKCTTYYTSGFLALVKDVNYRKILDIAELKLNITDVISTIIEVLLQQTGQEILEGPDVLQVTKKRKKKKKSFKTIE